MDHIVVTKAQKSNNHSDAPAPEDSSKRKLDSDAESSTASSKRRRNASQPFMSHDRYIEADFAQSVWFEKLFERRAGRDEPLEDDERGICDVPVERMDEIDVFHLDTLGTLEDFEALLGATEDAM
ncbi:hypothetical protein MSAN_00419900 [Mycena sanguinolenta]|uniref:Uncharacterized protein n=1 Tax=Mycena sanguinolenta TaxID=230812 RepID=A0A8H6ZA69_9AGAR|nr:hypothetical protein MSAN_00419900 [Mycena sanguinolenta]